MALWGILLILVGIILAYFSFGGEAKISFEDVGVAITASAGIIILILGFVVLFMFP